MEAASGGAFSDEESRPRVEVTDPEGGMSDQDDDEDDESFFALATSAGTQASLSRKAAASSTSLAHKDGSDDDDDDDGAPVVHLRPAAAAAKAAAAKAAASGEVPFPRPPSGLGVVPPALLLQPLAPSSLLATHARDPFARVAAAVKMEALKVAEAAVIQAAAAVAPEASTKKAKKAAK
jgi:hypothetical protein